MTVAEWFCPATLANLGASRRVAIVVWDAETDEGYQLIGEVVAIRDLSIADGYMPTSGAAEPAQAKRALLV
jgi:hypothetical protein